MKFRDLVRLILEILRYVYFTTQMYLLTEGYIITLIWQEQEQTYTIPMAGDSLNMTYYVSDKKIYFFSKCGIFGI